MQYQCASTQSDSVVNQETKMGTEKIATSWSCYKYCYSPKINTRMHNVHHFRIACILTLFLIHLKQHFPVRRGPKKDQIKIKVSKTVFGKGAQQRQIKTFDLDLFDFESAACLTSRGCLKGRKSIPPMYGCSAFGTSTPSSFWKFSRIQHSVLSVAVNVELSI